MDLRYIPSLPVRMVTRPCYVYDDKALFHMFAEFISPGSHEWRALVEYEDGSVAQVPATEVVFADGGEFDEIEWRGECGNYYAGYRKPREDTSYVSVDDVLDIIEEIHSNEEGRTAEALFLAYKRISELPARQKNKQTEEDGGK